MASDLKKTADLFPGVVIHEGQQCVGIKRNGKRCRITARHGEDYCLAHGGRTEQLANDVRERLHTLTPLAIDVFEAVLTEAGEPCALCGHSRTSMKKLKAAQLLLDRVGIGPVLKVEHSGTISHDILVERMTDDEIATVDDIMQNVLQRVQAEMDEDAKRASAASDGGES